MIVKNSPALGFVLGALLVLTLVPSLGRALIFITGEGTSAPSSAPGSFAAVEHNGNVDLSWDAVTGADTYTVDFRLATDTLWTNDSDGADLIENVAALTNDVKYDFRVCARNAGGCGPYSQLNDIVPAVLADLIRSFDTGNANDRIWVPKRKDTMFEDTARTDEVDVTGDKILGSTDLSTNAATWTQATAGDEPDWDSDHGSYWNGDTNGDVHMDFDATTPSFAGEFVVCLAFTNNNSNSFHKYLRAAAATNALRRQSSDGSLWRLIGTTNDVTFTNLPSLGASASTYVHNSVCFERDAGNTLRGYLQAVGADPDNPVDSTWSAEGTVAGVTGTWAPTILGNETGTGGPEGHIHGILIRARDFDDDAERTAIFEDLLDLIKM